MDLDCKLLWWLPIGNKFSNEIFSLSTQHRINKCNELINEIFLVSLFTLSKQSLEAEPSGVCLHRSHPWANPRFSLQSPYLLQHQSRAQELQSLLETSTYNLILVSFIFQGSCFYFSLTSVKDFLLRWLSSSF